MSRKVDLLERLRYPTDDEFSELGKELSIDWKNIFLERVGNRNEDSPVDYFFGRTELIHVYGEFNSRVFHTRMAYKLALFAYDKGIPDEPWNSPSGSDGRSTLFPNFTENVHYANQFWFFFYAESFYAKFQGIIDFLYHVINLRYGFYVETGLDFKRKVSKELKKSGPDFLVLLQRYWKNNDYRQLREYRNDIIHNSRPGDISDRISKHDSGVVSYGIGKYTPSEEIKRNMDANIKVFGEYMLLFKKYL
ncbi:Cthe_2314 family HEPN domain-containing protein [Bacillus sp. FSL W7-1360]